MRPIIFILHFVFLISSYGQLTEDFSDGNILANPIWSGDTSKFTVANQILQSNSRVVSDVFYISTPNQITGDAQWDFWINLQFSTSSANYTDVFLASDSQNLTKTQNGLFVRIGNTKDEVSVYELRNGVQKLLLDGQDGKTNNKEIRIRVTCEDILLQLWVDYDGGTLFQNEGSTNTYRTGAGYFGILVKQSTASFHQKHFVDDIYAGPLIKDTLVAQVTQVDLSADDQVQVTFDDVIVNTELTKYTLSNGYGSPDNVTSDLNSNKVLLSFSAPIANGTYTLRIQELLDIKGNRGDTTVAFTVIKAIKPKSGDLLLTEIFADPTPSFGLPEEEYIELYNNTTQALDIENCTFSDGGTPALLPKTVLMPYSFIILTKAGNESLFSGYGQTIGLTGFPALNNTGDNLEIRNSQGELVDAASYSEAYYHSDTKKLGGYALERISYSTACADIDNWSASKNTSGGTPGQQNSLFGADPDQDPPQIQSHYFLNTQELRITLSENLKENLAKDLANFELVETSENPINIITNSTEKTLTLTFASPFELNTIYHLLIKELEDCKGNTLQNTVVLVITTTSAHEGDILINELLFNPKEDGVDFMELYNNSDKYLRLSDLLLARYDKVERKDEKQMTYLDYILHPHHFLALTKDTVTLKSQYNTQHILQIASLPPMNNDAGIVLLLDQNGIILDSVPYAETQHFELLSDVSGVSLERTNYSGKSYNPMNWHSASTSAGYATPGFQNSQFLDLSKQNNSYTFVSKTFSPDGDGYEDLLALHYQNEENGYTANGYVFDLAGTYIHQPINMKILGTDGLLSWNGILSNGTKIPVGNYVLLLETFNLNGKVDKKKLAFSVVGLF
jgi:hypothetical protein